MWPAAFCGGCGWWAGALGDSGLAPWEVAAGKGRSGIHKTQEAAPRGPGWVARARRDLQNARDQLPSPRIHSNNRYIKDTAVFLSNCGISF